MNFDEKVTHALNRCLQIFCHNYYLHNLCDETRFPDWPIAEPVEVFRACLEEFKKQLTRDEEEEEVALEGARKVLDLKSGDGSKELRKAYRVCSFVIVNLLCKCMHCE